MNVTSAQFRTDNKILFKAPIITTAGCITESKYGRYNHGGAGDYIDLNSNNQVDIRSSGGGFSRVDVNFTEPNLKIPMETLRAAAKSGDHGEVLTADILGAEQIQDVHLNYGWGAGSQDVSNQRSLGTLVERFAPLDMDKASYAIDLTTNEFVIYTPNAKPAG
jgi:hypothetical protein